MRFELCDAEHPKIFYCAEFRSNQAGGFAGGRRTGRGGILEHPEEVFWLSLQEIKEVIEMQRADRSVITCRQEKFQHDEKLTPPRVITSEGEIITAEPEAHAPPGALAGSPGPVRSRAVPG